MEFNRDLIMLSSYPKSDFYFLTLTIVTSITRHSKGAVKYRSFKVLKQHMLVWSMYALFDVATYESVNALFGKVIGHCLRDNQTTQPKKLGRGVPPRLHQLVIYESTS
jgi:hypothetical protein